jgi:hypothetical protein
MRGTEICSEIFTEEEYPWQDSGRVWLGWVSYQGTTRILVVHELFSNLNGKLEMFFTKKLLFEVRRYFKLAFQS